MTHILSPPPTLSLSLSLSHCDSLKNVLERKWYQTGKGTEENSYKLVMDCSGENSRSKASGREMLIHIYMY